MKKSLLKKLLLITGVTIVLIAVFAISQKVFGVSKLDASDVSKIYADSGTGTIGGVIIGVVQYVCYGVAVGIILWKGVQFMIASPDGKAEVKKELIAVAIGGGILFTIGTIVRIVANISQTTLPA